jgi:DNA-binding transcriptional regulator YdaS (Cro superfamily)
MSATKSVLRAYREAQKVSLSDFAAQLGIPAPTLRSLENGWRPITAERAKDIEEKTRGRLTRTQLRPDLFGELPKRKRREEVRA